MKQVIQKIWMVIALLCASVSASAYDFEVDGIYYTVTSLQDLTCEVSAAPDENGDTKRSHYTGEIVIPSTVEFKGRTLSVNRIGEDAFRRSDVTSVSLPNTVIKIGEDAFAGCTGLTSISLPESVTSIGEGAFAGCTGLTSISLPESVTSIGESAFAGCTGLTSISLPNSLTYIGRGTFYSCSSLTSISLPNSLTQIGESAFEKCTSLTSISFPESLSSIGPLAFNWCTSIKTIKLPDSLKSLSYGVFTWNTSLTEINIPANIQSIEIWGSSHSEDSDYPFYRCTNLKKIRIEANYKTIKFKYKDGFPEKWYEIDFSNSWRFFYGTEITELYLEHNFNWINYSSNYISKDGSIFTELQKLELGGNLQVLSSYEYNNKPSKVLMPESLTEIICHSLVPPTIEGYYFSNSHYLNTVVKVPTESLEAYKNAEPWKNFWEIQGCEDVGVETVEVAENPIEVARYDLYGRCVSADYEGIVIIKYSDGSSKKIINRNI